MSCLEVIYDPSACTSSFISSSFEYLALGDSTYTQSSEEYNVPISGPYTVSLAKLENLYIDHTV